MSAVVISLLALAASAPQADQARRASMAAEVRVELQQGDAIRALEQAASLLLPDGLSAPFAAAKVVEQDPLLATLLARAAQQTGKVQVALPLYLELHRRAAALGDEAVAARLALRLADAHLNAGHHNEAIVWFGRVSDGDLTTRATLGLARALRLAGRPGDGLGVTQTAAATAGGWRARLLAEQARCARAAGDRQRHIAALVQLWVHHPVDDLTYSGSPAATDPDPFAGVNATVLTREAGAEGRVQRAEALLEHNHLQDALTAARQVKTELKPLHCRARYVEGKTLRNLRRYRDAEPVLEAVARDCPEQTPQALYLMGRIATFRGQHQRALALYNRFVAAFPQHPYGDDVLFFAGDVHTKQNQHTEAERYYQRAVLDYPEGDYRDDARWRLAWGAHLAGDDVKARERLDSIARESASTPDGRAFQQAVYWRARLGATADLAGAIDELDGLVRADPISYYSVQARALLHRLAPARAKAMDIWLQNQAQKLAEREDNTLFFVDISAARLGHALVQVGLDEEACEVLSTLSLDKLELRGVLAVAHDLALCGDAHASHWVVRKRAEQELRGRPAVDDADLWRAGYPQGYQSFVARWADHRALDRMMVLALIREESAFEAPVISWAGAVGLMQLMPFTAREEAAFERIKDFDVAQLTEPALNIRLGTAHIARRIRTFKGNAALAIAAYNAGPTNVRRWLERTPDKQLDGFIESIPVEQTREYTKRVLQSWAVYRYLYTPEAPWLDLPATAG